MTCYIFYSYIATICIALEYFIALVRSNTEDTELKEDWQEKTSFESQSWNGNHPNTGQKEMFA